MPAPVDGEFPDARLQVPLEVGDWVDFSGTLYKIAPLGLNDRANTNPRVMLEQILWMLPEDKRPFIDVAPRALSEVSQIPLLPP